MMHPCLQKGDSIFVTFKVHGIPKKVVESFSKQTSSDNLCVSVNDNIIMTDIFISMKEVFQSQ